MPVFKDEKRGTWYVMAWYRDWTGARKQKCKRGFPTKRDAQDWEHGFKLQTCSDLDIIQIIKANLLFVVRSDPADPEESIIAIDLGHNSFRLPIMEVSIEAEKHLGSFFHFAKGLRDPHLIFLGNAVFLYTGMALLPVFQGFRQSFHRVERHELLSALFSHHHMTFEAFVELYTKDKKPRLKENTWLTKDNIIQQKILPYFGKRKISEITTKDVIAWQNEMLAYRDEKRKPYSQTYLKTLHNQLSAIFNHAVRYYDLRSNPAAKAGNMGVEERKEMLFWTKAEYQRFADAMMDKPVSYYAFEMLYWCGIREGELLALTPADFDFEASTVRINKSYQRLHGEDVITTPKTPKSNRTIKMPDFLRDEMKDYIGMLYGVRKKDRIFTVTKSYLHHEMDRGAKEAGVKRIRIHDLRHSHISLLIDMGFSAVAIADRVGHESIEITYRYAHLFPSKQAEMADKLNTERGS